MYYASIGVLSLIIHIIINYEALRRKRGRHVKPTQIRYRHFLYTVMLYYVADVLWGYFYEKRWVIPTYIDTVLFFISMVFSVLMWTRFVVAFIDNRGRFGKLLLFGGWFIATFELIALVVNLFYPMVFGFGVDKEYQPGQTRYITLLLQMFLFICTSVYTLTVARRVKGEDRAHHRTIGFSGIVMSLFILLQSLYPLMPFYSIGCLLATCMIHSFVYKDEMLEHFREMEIAKRLAHRDPLTGVRNKLSYLENLKELELRIENGDLTEYGVVVFDLNGLKQINDELGHDSGDDYIKAACRIICHTFKHSPVFRIGGDEFVAILEREDYEKRDELIAAFNTEVEENQQNGDVVVACGMDIYDPKNDSNYNDVFRRADKKMYQRKEALKSGTR